MTRPLPLLVAAFLISGCGGSVESKSQHHQDAGTEAAPPDAGSDVVQQEAAPPPPLEAGPEATPDSGPEPGLGSACDGKNGNPSSCQSGLSCYTAQGDPNQQGRWPGGYCTLSCHGNSTCAPFGGVCAGAAFGGGKCLQPCTKPTDCRQGYACRADGFQSSQTVCTPTGFIATRDAGVACFQHSDPSGQYYAPTLDHGTFTTSEQVDTTAFSSDEIAFAMNSANQVVVGANTITQGGYSNPSMYATGASLPLSFAQANGPQYSSAAYYSDPFVVAASDGTFYYSTLGLNGSATMAWLVVGHSTDGGQTWQSVKVDPDTDCAGSLGGPQGGPCLDHPWLAVGPDVLNPSQDAVYAAYLATRSSTSMPTVLIRSTDGGKTWGIPGSPDTSLAVFDDAGYYSNLITPTVDSTGVVHMVSAWISLTYPAQDPQHGSPYNAIMYSRSVDGGKTRTDPTEVSQQGEAVPFEQPAIATDNGNIYVAYVSGKANSTDTGGDWNIVLATSQDGQTWTHQTVNDNPSGCATNFHPAIAVDHTSHKVYVAWYDGRFAPYEGNIALTVCTPATTGNATCTPNVAINDKPFYITTDRNDLTFIGDYFTLHVKPGGEVWAGYGDTEINGISHAFLATGTP